LRATGPAPGDAVVRIARMAKKAINAGKPRVADDLEKSLMSDFLS
jgi:hypothetical protein